MKLQEKKVKAIRTVLGFVLVLFAMYMVVFEDKGDMIIMFFFLFGGFLISASLIKDFVQDVWSKRGS